jgi:carboxymethylenebutenolidase
MTKETYITLSVSDNTSMQAYTLAPEGKGPFPAMIVFQEAFGVNNHIKDICKRFADLGYITIAPELFHRSAAPGFVAAYTDFPSVLPHIQATNAAKIGYDAQAVYDWLLQQNQVKKESIACIGFCMGGRASFVANTLLPLKAAISFYGGAITPELSQKAATLHAPHLFFWGGKDNHIPAEQIDTLVKELKAAGKEFTQVILSEGDHGFFCNERASYHPASAEQAWALTKTFLEQKMR